jgi:hypothetical protein
MGWSERRRRETLRLTQIRHLNREALVEVRRDAFRMEKRAYEISKVLSADAPSGAGKLNGGSNSSMLA